MKDLKIRKASLNDIFLIRSISEQTWPSTYGHIISQEQIDFMLEWMYSQEALTLQMENGVLFFIAMADGKDIGFCSVSNEHEKNNEVFSHKLNKLYVLPEAQGWGAGNLLLNKAIEISKNAGSHSLFLQVNKLNKAYTFYLKNGFVKELAFKFDIGNGFFMDDFVMRLRF